MSNTFWASSTATAHVSDSTAFRNCISSRNQHSEKPSKPISAWPVSPSSPIGPTTMQRRVASSTRAIRRTLQRRLDRSEKALADPVGYLRSRKAFQESVLADAEDLEDLDENARWQAEEAALE